MSLIIPPQVKLLGYGLIASAIFWGGCSVQKGLDAGRIASLNSSIYKMKTDAAEAGRKHTEEVRQREHQHADALAKLDKKYAQEKENAEHDYKNTIAAIRSNNLQLRKRFICPKITSEAPAPKSGINEEERAGLQKEDAEFLVSESERADQITRERNELIDIIEQMLK